MCEFPFIFFVFYTLFCSLSQNKPGRQDVPFVVLGHKCKLIRIAKFITGGNNGLILLKLQQVSIFYVRLDFRSNDT